MRSRTALSAGPKHIHKDSRHVRLDLDRKGDKSLEAIRNSTEVPASNSVLDWPWQIDLPSGPWSSRKEAAKPLKSEPACKVRSRDFRGGKVLLSLFRAQLARSLPPFELLLHGLMPRGLCARWRGARPRLLHDLPISLWLASVDD
jgi:hypothetical protein